MFAYISANREDLLGVGTLVAMEITVAGYALRKNIKRGCTIPHARACTHTRTAAADQEKMTQAVGSKLLRYRLQRKSAVSIMLESNDKIAVRTLVIC